MATTLKASLSYAVVDSKPITDPKVLEGDTHAMFSALIHWRVDGASDKRTDVVLLKTAVFVQLALPHPLQSVWNWLQDPHNQRVMSDVLVVAGGVLTIAGVVLTPVTLGGSIAISAVGGVLAVIGAAIQTKLDAKDVADHFTSDKNNVPVVYISPDKSSTEPDKRILEGLKKIKDEMLRSLEEMEDTVLVLYKEVRYQACKKALDSNFEHRTIDDSEIRMNSIMTREFIDTYNILLLRVQKRIRIHQLEEEWFAVFRDHKAPYTTQFWMDMQKKFHELGKEISKDGSSILDWTPPPKRSMPQKGS